MSLNPGIPLSRRDAILQRLDNGEPVVATALALEFAVSEDAIRRDLRALAAQGRCRRVYGGALPLGPGAKPMAARLDEGLAQKAALAQAAVASLQRGEFIFLDASSTHLALVDRLPDDFGLTVATNAIDIAAAVLRRGDVPLIVVGGAVEPDVGGCVDASAVQAVSAMAIDRCFLGACAVSAATGVGATHHADAHFKRALMAASHAVVVLATTEKLHAKAPHKVTALAGVSLLVLEADAPPEAVSALHRAGATVHLAAPATADPHRAGGAA